MILSIRADRERPGMEKALISIEILLKLMISSVGAGWEQPGTEKVLTLGKTI